MLRQQGCESSDFMIKIPFCKTYYVITIFRENSNYMMKKCPGNKTFVCTT